MSTVIIRRRPRQEPPPTPDGTEELNEPPIVPDPAPPDLRSLLMYLPMALGPAALVLVYASSSGGAPATTTYVLGGAMCLSMVAMGLSQVGRAAADRKRKLGSERRDFMRYLEQTRATARQAADRQRAAVLWDNPDPSWLWSLAQGSRLWERRGSHPDFAKVRFGLGRRPAAMTFAPPSTKPVEDLEPLSAISLRRFTETYSSVNGIPMAVGLRSFVSVELAGDAARARDLARALLAQLVTLHAPDELLVAVLTDPAVPEWNWLKWLPHHAHPTAWDDTGRVRLLAFDHQRLLALLGDAVLERGEHEASFPSVSEPFVVVVADRVAVPADSPLRGPGLRGVTLLDVSGELPGGEKVLRLTCRDSQVEFPAGGGTERAVPDRMSPAVAESLARLISPRRTGGTVEVAEQPFESDFELPTLLGLGELGGWDVAATWRGTIPQRNRLQVPIGVAEDGEVVHLDLKEPAQGGVGPHGMLIGATGSGKSELLRTLVCSLAATHSSEILNFVLVDFKGGATFLGMHQLPHLSAMITNLSDELPLVDRMQDAISGELNRRQELLRAAGHASQFEYEKARAAGAQLPALPTLLVVVDEFSELLGSKPDFMELFASIGRLGRSLGVHLLLASQRLDEGRINRVEGHLSYRIGLRTFSAMESRSVIGTADAYELPSTPGNGYLRTDTTSLLRFKGAYVSGPCADGGPAVVSGEEQDHRGDVVEFTAASAVDADLAAPVPAPRRGRDDADDAETTGPQQTVADVMLAMLAGKGPAAHQVWLPPLTTSASVDALLPGLVPDPARGMTVAEGSWQGSLRVPVGLVDLPYEQVRDLLVAELGGADGHVGVVGAPQTGKSTLLRTLMLTLALTHTPQEVQFYCLDLAGGGLTSMNGLPHVGSVAGRLERDRVTRTVNEVLAIMENREQRFAELGVESMAAYRQARRLGTVDDPFGDVFLVVDGWAALRQDYDDLDQRLPQIASRGLSLGIHLVIGATRWSDMRPWLRDVIGTRFELRLGDPVESEVPGRLARNVPHQPGRGLTSGGAHFLGALPRIDGGTGLDGLPEATRAAVAEVAAFWSGAPAPAVRLLPTSLPAADLPEPRGSAVCLGQDEHRLEGVWHDFMVTPHLLVMGDQETGKTNLLQLVAGGVRRTFGPDRAKFVLGDSLRGLDGVVPADYRLGHAVTTESLKDLIDRVTPTLRSRLPGPDIAPEDLPGRGWWQGADLFVLVDDYELLAGQYASSSPLEALLPFLAQGVHVGLHLIVARSTANAVRGMMDPVLRRLWELSSPTLLFSCPREEGRFIGDVAPRQLPPGRAQLATRRQTRLIQTALASVHQEQAEPTLR